MCAYACSKNVWRKEVAEKARRKGAGRDTTNERVSLLLSAINVCTHCIRHLIYFLCSSHPIQFPWPFSHRSFYFALGTSLTVLCLSPRLVSFAFSFPFIPYCTRRPGFFLFCLLSQWLSVALGTSFFFFSRGTLSTFFRRCTPSSLFLFSALRLFCLFCMAPWLPFFAFDSPTFRFEFCKPEAISLLDVNVQKWEKLQWMTRCIVRYSKEKKA